MELNIADIFEAVVEAVPERTALVGATTRLTYRDLDKRSNRFAHHLLDCGVAPGSFVGVLSHNRVEWLEAMIGCFKSRTVPVNLNHRYVAPELRYVAENADLAAIVLERSFIELVDESCEGLPLLNQRLVIDDRTPGEALSYEQALTSSRDDRSGFPTRSGDDLYVLYTGGTTGMPKGVLWRQEDLYLGPLGGTSRRGGPVTSVDDIRRRVPRDDARQTALVVPPLMHGTAQWTSLSPLLSGGTVVLYTEHHFLPEKVWELVERERVTVLVMVGDVMGRPLAEALERAPHAYDTSSLAIILSSGAPLTDPVRDQLLAQIPRLRILNRLGSSESGTMGVASGRGEDSSNPRNAKFAVSDDTAVLDEALSPVRPGSAVVGRLARRGQIPLGYHKDPSGSAATFVVDADGTRWVLPGDFATVLEDGSITLLGRGSTTINSGGEKIYPHEVEAALKSHPDVFSAVVVGIPDERFGERVAAVVQARPDRSPSVEDLIDHCRTMVAGYKVPRTVKFVDEVPLTAVGKPDHRAARELLVNETAQGGSSAH